MKLFEIQVMMEKIERQEALIEELTTRGTHVGLHGVPKVEDSK